MRERAHRLARRFTVVTGAAVLIFGVWTQVVIHHGAFPDFLTVGAVLAIVASAWLLGERREGWAFAMTAFAMAATVLTFFTDLYPNVMVSSTDAAVQPDGAERVVCAVRAQGDDDRGGHLPSGRDDLSGLDVSRLPEAAGEPGRPLQESRR